MREFGGRTAVITGGASGIGLAVARRLADEGMNLVLADIEEPALHGVVADFEARDVPVLGVRTDVADVASVAALADAAADRFGPVHVLFNNAGVGIGGPLLSDDPKYLDRFAWTLGVNLWGVLYGIRAFVPGMVAHGEPAHVVTTASMAGLLPAQLGAYTVSKYGAVALSEMLVQEVAGTSVGVSVLCPGFVRTGIGESERNLPEHLVSLQEPTPEQEERGEIIREFVESGMDPAEVAGHVRDAIVDGRFWILTHPDFAELPRERAEQIVAGTAPTPSEM